jgi:hypothetical protein
MYLPCPQVAILEAYLPIRYVSWKGEHTLHRAEPLMAEKPYAEGFDLLRIAGKFQISGTV